jgi:hypothetical protein
VTRQEWALPIAAPGNAPRGRAASFALLHVFAVSRCPEQLTAPPVSRTPSPAQEFESLGLRLAANAEAKGSPNMPWMRWIEWFSGKPRGLLAPNMAITLVTLRIEPAAGSEEVGFYRGAEYDALLEWAKMGRFVLALVGTDRDELTLLCIQSPEEMHREVAKLPLVAAGLATFDIRPAMSLRMNDEEFDLLQ